MGNIEKFLSNNSYAPRIDRQPSLPDGDNNLYKEKLVFSPSELKLGGKRPTRITLTENQVETKLFEKYGFNVKNKVQFEMLKLRFDTKNSPFSEINWEKGSFVAQLNSAGQYEITLALRESTLEALSGRLISAPAPNNNPQNPDPNKTTASMIGINSADYRRFQIENKLQPNLTDLTPEQQALVMDLTQIGLSVVGIFDPTGLADGADAMISLGRGDYWGAGISALGIIPYIGDLAKVGKLPKLLKTVENIVTMAKTDTRFAKIVEPLLKGLKNSLDSLPINKLPNWAKEPLEKLSAKIDEFFGIRKVVSPALTPSGQKAVTLNTLEHIFHGEINKKGKAVGFHYEDVENMQAVNKTRTVTVTKPPDKNGVYVAKVEVNGIAKKAESSFFPKTWTKNDVVNSINEAYIKKVHPDPNNSLYFEGRSSSGVLIGGYLKSDGTVSTAFPLYGR